MIDFIVNMLSLGKHFSVNECLVLYTVCSIGVMGTTMYNMKYRTLRQAYISRVLLIVFLSLMVLFLLSVVLTKVLYNDLVVLLIIPFTALMSYIFLKDVRAINRSRRY
jgi:hypothetical protein